MGFTDSTRERYEFFVQEYTAMAERAYDSAKRWAKMGNDEFARQCNDRHFRCLDNAERFSKLLEEMGN